MKILRTKIFLTRPPRPALLLTLIPMSVPIKKIDFKNMILSADNGFLATNAADISLDNVKIIPKTDPVFLLNHVKNINIKKGYFPITSKIFYKADAATTGINISQTDLRN